MVFFIYKKDILVIILGIDVYYILGVMFCFFIGIFYVIYF